jgi:poly(A) polymerase
VQIIPRNDHNVSRSQISEAALKVLYRLKKAGYQSYLVGGGVRDLLLEGEPKDFDIATDATPEDVRKLFSNCRLIGRRFRLAHVHFGREIIEVATFRGQHEGDQGEEGQTVNGMIVRDNVYGTLEEDAQRRDFTVNSLYYNIYDFSIVDHVGGMQDMQARQLRLIGDPVTRYNEDPVRMLRVARFAAKLDFSIEAATEAPITELAPLLADVPPARLFEEVLKLLLSGKGERTYEILRQYGLFGELFPQAQEALEQDGDVFDRFIATALRNSDQRIAEGKPVTPAFIFAAILWEPARRLRNHFMERGMTESQALADAANAVIAGQVQRISVPRRFHVMIKEIWHFQDRLQKRVPKRSLRLLTHPRFRAGYDFLLLRAEVGDESAELAEWWTDFSQSNEQEQEKMVKKFRGPSNNRRRRRRSPKKTSSS